MSAHKQLLLLTLITGLILGATGCKKPPKGTSYGSGSGSANSDPSGADASALLEEAAQAAKEEVAMQNDYGGAAIEEPVPEGEQSLIEKFVLTKWMKTRPKMQGLVKYIEEGGGFFFMGDKDKFRIETNGTFGVSPDFELGPEELRLFGNYWLKAYALGQHLKPEDDDLGLFLDTGVDATLGDLSMDMWFRVVGEDIAARSIMAGFDQIITREKSFSPAAIPGVVGELALGGEMGFRAEFGVRRDNVLNLIYTPRANIAVKASAGVGAKDIATTGIKGTVRIADILLPSSANIGFHQATNLMYFDFGLDAGEIKLIDGNIYYVPAEVLGKELGKISIWNPEPVETMPTPSYTSALVKFLEPPANCQAAKDSAGNMLAGSIVKLKQYLEQAPQEDYNKTLSSIARAGLVFEKVKSACN